MHTFMLLIAGVALAETIPWAVDGDRYMEYHKSYFGESTIVYNHSLDPDEVTSFDQATDECNCRSIQHVEQCRTSTVGTDESGNLICLCTYKSLGEFHLKKTQGATTFMKAGFRRDRFPSTWGIYYEFQTKHNVNRTIAMKWCSNTPFRRLAKINSDDELEHLTKILEQEDIDKIMLGGIATRDDGLRWNDDTELWSRSSVDLDDTFGPIVLTKSGKIETVGWRQKLAYMCTLNPFGISW